MSLSLLEATVAGLPWRLREEVIGYSGSVAESIQELFSEAGLAFDDQLADQLLFIAGIRRLWSIVNGRYWLLERSLAFIEGEAAGVTAGSRVFRRGDGEMLIMRRLRDDLMSEIDRLQIKDLVSTGSLVDVLQSLRAGA